MFVGFAYLINVTMKTFLTPLADFIIECTNTPIQFLFHFVLALRYCQTPFALPVLRINYALAEPLSISLVLPALKLLACCPRCLTCSDTITESPSPTPLLFWFCPFSSPCPCPLSCPGWRQHCCFTALHHRHCHCCPCCHPRHHHHCLPPPTKFSKLEFIFDVQHTYFITFLTGIKR